MGAAKSLGDTVGRAFQAPVRPVRALLQRLRDARLRERERIRHEHMSEWNAAALWLHDQAACAEDDRESCGSERQLWPALRRNPIS